MAVLDTQRQTASAAVGRVEALLSRLDPGEPHPFQGPFTRWPRYADTVLALIVFAVSIISVVVSDLAEREAFNLAAVGDRPIGGFALLALAAAALLWRRGHSIAVIGFILMVMTVWAFAGYGDGHEPAALVATYSVGRYAADHRRSLVTAAIVAVVGVIGTIVDPNQRVDIAPAIIGAGLPWYLGRLVRNRHDYLVLLQDRAERLEAEQQARARQAVAEERTRIARELHDVVAHRVSMMTVQAGAAKTIARADLDSAIGAMGEVEHEGRQALTELRHLLGVLRPEHGRSGIDEPGDLGPQPGLADIPALIDQFAAAGAEVTFTGVDDRTGIPAAVELSAYRIVQESLTNVVKHGGEHPAVEVVIRRDGDLLDVDITNTVGASVDNTVGAATLPPSGFGIVGMRERATLLGGTLTAHRLPDRYRVQARLPLEPESS